MLQPFDQDSSDNSRHKFMVQSMFVPDDVTENHDLLVSLLHSLVDSFVDTVVVFLASHKTGRPECYVVKPV